MHVENVQLCQCHVIVIAVKPYLVAKVLEEIKDHLKSHHVIVSLAAAVTLADMSAVSISIAYIVIWCSRRFCFSSHSSLQDVCL